MKMKDRQRERDGYIKCERERESVRELRSGTELAIKSL